MIFIWQNKDWLNFRPEDFAELNKMALELARLENQITELLEIKDLSLLMLRAMEREIKNSNAIEGERMDSMILRSSLARDMGIVNMQWSAKRQDSGKERRAVKAALEFLRNGTELDLQNILDTHAMLAPEGESWGKIRDHPESVYGENNISVYDAPGKSQEEVIKLLNDFLIWWKEKRPLFPPAIGSALAHFSFVTIHPFRDGNGRLARMIADKALIQEKSRHTFRLFSLSAAINGDKNKYYELLNCAQLNNEIRPFLDYMLKFQESALQTALAQAQKLATTRAYIKSSSCIFSWAEIEILYEMATGNREFWTFFEATKYMEDGEAAEDAWVKLHELGIVKNGVLNITPERK